MMNNFLYVTDIKPQNKPGRQEPPWTIVNWRHRQRLQILIWPQFQLCETPRKIYIYIRKSTSETQTTNKPGETPKGQDTLHRSSFTCRAGGCGRKHPGSSRRWPPHRRPLETTSSKSPPSKPRENATRLLSLPFSLVLPLFSLLLSLSLPFLSTFTAATKTYSSASGVFLLCTPYSQESMQRKRRRWRWQRPPREETRRWGGEREESERARRENGG